MRILPAEAKATANTLAKGDTIMKHFWFIAATLMIFSLVTHAGPLSGLDAAKEGRSMRASSSDPNWRNGNGDARPIPSGEALVIADLEGPGRINHIWNTVAANERGYSRLLVVRMYWDGEEQPSVEAPLGDFFVIGNGLDRSMQSLPVVVSSDGRARNCYWPMPFRKSARITITNEGEQAVQAFFWYVDWQQLPSLPKDTPYFHASYRQEYPTVSGRNYLIADIEGRGHYVGTVENVRMHGGSWYGEGDDFFFIDGEEEPSLRGTGSEDYFCDAWGFRRFDGPYYGVPVWEGFNELGRITAYRWHLTDPVLFEKSLRVEIEHKGVTFNEDGGIRSGFEERTDDYASMAFWYQQEPHKPFEPMPSAYDRVLVDWRNAVEIETLVEGDALNGVPFIEQAGGGWSNGKQILWTPRETGKECSVPLQIPEDGEYALTLVLTTAPDYGDYQVMLDERPLGAPVRLFTGTVITDEFTRPLGKVAAGDHTLRFVSAGKNDASTGYFLGLDAYLLSRLGDASRS